MKRKKPQGLRFICSRKDREVGSFLHVVSMELSLLSLGKNFGN